jgi:hypothetical protein
MRFAHVLRNGSRNLNLNQFTFANSRAPLPGLPPVPLVADEFRPEWKRRTLKWLGYMYRAAAVFQKFALGMSRHAQAPQITSAVNIALFESRGSHSQMHRQTGNIRFRQINETLLFTAFRATGLTLESHKFLLNCEQV